MTITTGLAFAISAISIATALLSVAYTKATAWQSEQARLWRVDPERARTRDADPPRYVSWLP